MIRNLVGNKEQSHLFTNKEIWNLIWPLVIEQFLAIFLGMADIIMVASLGEEAVSSVSLVDTIFIFINQLFAALATGGAVVCSQFIGQRKAGMASKTAIQLIYAVISGAVIVAVLCFPFKRIILKTIFGDIEPQVLINADIYFSWTLVSLAPVALYNACAALFRSQGNSRISMYTGVIINVVNILGNALFLFVLHSGVEGVAIPTCISRTLASLILLTLLWKKKAGKKQTSVEIKNAEQSTRVATGSQVAQNTTGSQTTTDTLVAQASQNAQAAEEITTQSLSDNYISIREIFKFHFEPHLIKKILQIGLPNGIENSIFQVGKILVLSIIATFGTSAIAANSISNTISSFEVLPGASIGLALLTVVGQCMGANRPDEAIYYVKKLMKLAYISMIAFNIPLLIFSEKLVSLYGMSPETSHLGWRMLMIHGLAGMLVWPSAFTLPNALRAANDAKFTMIVSLSSMWLIRIGMSYLYAYTFKLGAFGVWAAMSTDWFARTICFIWRFKSGKWKNRKLV